MHRLTYLAVVIYLAGVYGADFEKCMKIIDDDSRYSCCKVEPIKANYSGKIDSIKEEEKYKECEALPQNHDDSECSEKEMCIAKKIGTMNDKGEINEDKIKELLEQDIRPLMYPEVYDNMMKFCFGENLLKYKLENSCYFKQFSKCVTLQYVMGCAEWKDDQFCVETKNEIAECSKLLS